jgi:hypothetical protein
MAAGSRKAIINELHDAALLSDFDASSLVSNATETLRSRTGAAVADVTGTAGGAYTANEQGMLDDLVTAVNALIAALESTGTIAT